MTTETAPLTINSDDHWNWIRDLITEAETATQEAAEEPAPVRCTRCHRPLTSAKSIAAGRGRTCQKRTRQEAAVVGIKAATIAKAQELIEQGGIIPLRGKRVFQVIASNGIDRYLTAREACNCPAGVKGRHLCYHRVAATLLAA